MLGEGSEGRVSDDPSDPLWLAVGVCGPASCAAASRGSAGPGAVTVVVAVAVVCPTVAIAAWKIPNMLSSEDGSVTEVGRVDGVDSGRVELL